MTDIVTITPSPAVDLSTAVDRIVRGVAKLRGQSQRRRDPGGGGINVAPGTIRRLGGDARAIYPVGGAIGKLLRQLLDQEGVASHTLDDCGRNARKFLRRRGSARASNTASFFLVRGSTRVPAEGLEASVFALEPFPRYLVASGSLPEGVPDDFYAQVARLAKQAPAPRSSWSHVGSALAAAAAEGVV